MKEKVIFQQAAVTAISLGLALAVGCGGGSSPNPGASSDAEPVRGEPIQTAEVRGEPIQKPEVAAKEEPAAEALPAPAETAVATAAVAKPESAATEIAAANVEREPAKAAEAAAPMPQAPEVAPAANATAVENPVESPAPAPAPRPETATAPAAQPAAPAKPLAEPEVIKSGGQEYAQVTFDHLASFEYEMPDEFGEVDASADDASAGAAAEVAPEPKAKAEEKDQIPANVRKFNNRRVALEGFMLPLKVEDSLVTEMLIMRDQSMCCFGSVPKINEWVSIRMTGKGVKPIMDEPVTIFGKLKVGEIRENGYLVGIYEMDGERLGARIDL